MSITNEQAANLWYKQAKSKNNAKRAMEIALWLVRHNYGCALQETDDGVITITYAENKGEGKVWPSIRIDAGPVIWPKNSPLELMLEFLGV